MPDEEVTFYSGGCAIAGTFTEAADPVAAALLITGGGRTDRNSDARLPGGRMLRIGVDKAVAGARVCALRYDKRGVGASGGDYLRAGMDDRRADARAAWAGPRHCCSCYDTGPRSPAASRMFMHRRHLCARPPLPRRTSFRARGLPAWSPDHSPRWRRIASSRLSISAGCRRPRRLCSRDLSTVCRSVAFT